MTQANLNELMLEANRAADVYKLNPTRHNLACKFVAHLVYNAAVSSFYLS